MPKPTVVKRGSEYLPKMEVEDLEEMIRQEKPGKPRDRLQAAVLRKRGKTLEEIKEAIGYKVNTIHNWLAKLASEGLDSRYDKKSPGRPPRLTPEEENAIREDLAKSPQESGFERGSWNAKMVARRIKDVFGKTYSTRSSLRLAQKLGFSYRKPRPIPYNSATPEEQEAFIKKTRQTMARWAKEGRTTLALDAASLQDSPSSRRGLRRRGGSETVHTNFSKKSLHIIGALGDGTLDVQFVDDLSASSYIDLVEYARRRHKKIGLLCDNARALTGKEMRRYIERNADAVEILYLPPHTPQLNPIEIQWREIKVAIADLFYGGLDKMRDAIIRMLRKKEIPIVRLFHWLLSA